MKLGAKEIALGAALSLAGCESGTNMPQAPEPTKATVKSLEEICRERALAVARFFQQVAEATGGRFGSWDSASTQEFDDCMENQGGH